MLRARRIRVWLLAALCAGACGARSSVAGLAGGGSHLGDSGYVPDSGPASADLRSFPDVAAVSDGPARPACEHPPQPPGVCVSCVRASPVAKKPACWVDEVVSQKLGWIFYECGGGAAKLVLGAHTFHGTYAGGWIEVLLHTQFEWSDGCTWESTQRVGGPASGPLLYSYTEQPLPGQSGCLSSCEASAELEVWN